MRALLRPLWLTGHGLLLAAVLAMVWLGLWQWDRGETTGAVRNYSYAIEWYAFALLTLLGWLKICHDELVPDPNAGVSFGAVLPQASSTEVASWEDDPEVAAWNAQFRALHLRHALTEAGLSEADIARALADADDHNRPALPDEQIDLRGLV